MNTRATALTAAVVIALPVAWLAGEQHRDNCLSAGRDNCTVLPWDQGTKTHFTPAAGNTLDDKINHAFER
jgi:hypothetical protein